MSMSNQIWRPSGSNYIKSRTLLEEYFKDFAFFVGAYIKTYS